ncbi:uncharacterized protein LOC113650574 [Tachysurus fulvidraco]|uniref:uncharacterized protein LOC113650574 n=1 Tax=Tachysurus fulvidraco TaxID=1234273 RepID=UPI001FED554C|nr:uncharacterized protein LOC113650574 [Tachysurus fulvidraco]
MWTSFSVSSVYKNAVQMNMAQNYSSEVVLKITAETVLISLKGGISSLKEVYKALKTDIHPLTRKCSNYDYIRQQIVQAHQLLKQSEQEASSGLKSLDENLERLIQEEGKLKQEINDTILTLDNFRKEKESNEYLLSVSQGALEQTRRNLNSAIHTLQAQQKRKYDAEIVTGVGAGVLVIPIIGWIVGPAMIIGVAVELDQANKAVQVAQEEVRKSENEVRNYELKVSHYVSKISQTECDISQKVDQLKQIREGIQKVKKQSQSVAEFQGKVRGAVNLLGVLRGRVSVAEHQTRRSILQEPEMKVMEDVMKAIEQITGNELLYRNDLPRLNEMKENIQQLAAICASENSSISQ